ncbi:unnamed protein product [Nippostrongylus brasiliensis]|uniref:Lectin_legB domain-containing protein n=1 Tax=Nippostrongylus brasiliensis TaxID=27835 RepID=A0A0N4XJK0_NIPBR|nr:unnamed protein product [Nippostrongylus brasiliensis]
MTSYMIKYPDYYSTFLSNIFSSTNPKSIYVVFVEIYSSVSEDFYRKCAEFVTATGGAAFRFSDYATVRQYFGVYFNNVVGRDEVTYRSFNTDEMNSLSLVTYPFMLHDNATYSAVLIIPGGSSNVQSASLQSSNGNTENCDLQPIGGDLTLISLQSPIGSSSGSSQQRFQLKIQLRNSSPSWGKIFVYEELPSLSVSVALSATTIDDGNSETLCMYVFYCTSF